MSPNISILIVDDDMNKIFSIIKTVKEKVTIPLSIDQAECISEAQTYLKEKKYHLMISDILMPHHKGEILLENGGEILVKEIYKVRKGFNVPLYIVGLTQFEDYKGNFNKLWKVILYDISKEDWKVYLRDLIGHILLVKDYLLTNLLETIFVEGKSDKFLLEQTLQFYFPQVQELFSIETLDSGAGVSWVERKIQIWAKSLNKTTDGKFIKAVGLLDNDIPGLKVYNDLQEQFDAASTERKTFSLIITATKFSVPLKSIKNKGIEMYTVIEDLISIDVWKEAYTNGWLEPRLQTSFINVNKENINEKYFLSQGLTADETLQALHSVKFERKVAFAQLAAERKENLIYLSYLLKDCLDKLKIASYSYS